MRYLKTLVLLSLFSFIAACAPAITGSARMSPFDLDQDDIIIEPGGRYFIKSVRNPDLLDINFPQLNSQKLRNTNKGKRYYTSLNNTSISVSGIPDEWLELRSAKGVQTVTNVEKSSYSVHVWWSESVEFLFSLDVPADAEPGYHFGFVTLSSREGETIVPISVTVDEPRDTGLTQASN